MHTPLVKKQIERCFSKAAASYDDVAQLQHLAGRKLIDEFMPSSSYNTVLDLGCGTGYTTAWLSNRVRCRQILGLDIASSMLAHAQHQAIKPQALFLQADFEHVPLADQSIDCIFSNMALQWSLDFDRCLQECLRVLRNHGCMVLSFFIGVEQSCQNPLTVNQFRAPATILEQVRAAGFHVLRQEIEWQGYWFENRLALMQFFKKTGANYRMQRDALTLNKKSQTTWQDPIGEVRFQLFYLSVTKEGQRYD